MIENIRTTIMHFTLVLVQDVAFNMNDRGRKANLVFMWNDVKCMLGLK